MVDLRSAVQWIVISIGVVVALVMVGSIVTADIIPWGTIFVLLIAMTILAYWKDTGWAILVSILALTFFNYVVYQHAPEARLFTTAEGRTHLFAYVIGIVVLAIIIEKAQGLWKKLVALALVIAGFYILGPTTLKYLPDDIQARLHIPGLSGPRAVAQSSGMPTTCGVTVSRDRPIRLTSTPSWVPRCLVVDADFTGDVLMTCQDGRPVLKRFGQPARWPAGCFVQYIRAANAGETVEMWASFQPLTTARWTP